MLRGREWTPDASRASVTHRLFLLSPASLRGRRARLVLDDRARFDLAPALRTSDGVPLAEFVGRGDMSRGGLLLRRADEGRELTYVPIAGAVRHGTRPARLVPRLVRR